MSIRPVRKIVKARPTLEGAGVHLNRAFGFGEPQEFDPFLLFDDFRGDDPSKYLAGFPWHPHRGIETITYVLAGEVEHGDSMGNRGSIGARDIQWMTAGSGIIHQEMPKGDSQGRMHGFQLWANLPSALKMTSPRYQEVKSGDIPEVVEDDGTRTRVICGHFWGHAGRSRESRRIRSTSMFQCRPTVAGRYRLRRSGTPSPMSSPGRVVSATPPVRDRCPRNRCGGVTRLYLFWQTIAHLSFSTKEMRLRCRRARRGYGSCWFPDSH